MEADNIHTAHIDKANISLGNKIRSFHRMLGFFGGSLDHLTGIPQNLFVYIFSLLRGEPYPAPVCPDSAWDTVLSYLEPVSAAFLFWRIKSMPSGNAPPATVVDEMRKFFLSKPGTNVHPATTNQRNYQCFPQRTYRHSLFKGSVPGLHGLSGPRASPGERISTCWFGEPISMPLDPFLKFWDIVRRINSRNAVCRLITKQP